MDPRWPEAKLRELGYTEDSISGVMFIRLLSDEDVLAAARDDTSSGYRQVLAFMDRDTNRSWISGRCAEDAYLRGLIGETEFDYLSDHY